MIEDNFYPHQSGCKACRSQYYKQRRESSSRTPPGGIDTPQPPVTAPTDDISRVHSVNIADNRRYNFHVEQHVFGERMIFCTII